MYCRKCGKELTDEDLFCTSCGTKRLESETDNDKAFVISNKTEFKKFYEANRIPIICVFALICIFCIMFSVQHAKKVEKNNQWKSYKQSTNSSSGKSSSNVDFSSLHKYENSTYKVGSDMPAGEYVLFATGGSGYFCLSSDSGGDSIICNENFGYNSIITIETGEYLELSRCYAEKISDVISVTTSGEGMFKIGTHLPAGEYQLEASGGSGYYCVYDDDRQDDIATNDNFDGKTYVTVRNGQYLKLSRCKIVQ